MTKNTNTNNKILQVEEDAKKAVCSTLNKIFSCTGNKDMEKMKSNFLNDLSIIDNNKMDNISDAYDLYIIAYTYLYDCYINKNLTNDDIISIPLKNGNIKELKPIQYACRLVRQEIYKHSTQNPSSYLYINDFSQINSDGEQETSEQVTERLLRVNKYYDIDNYNDYVTINDIINNLKLTEREKAVFNLKMQGLGNTQVIERLNITKQNCTNVLFRIQEKIKALYPELLRQFKI